MKKILFVAVLLSIALSIEAQSFYKKAESPACSEITFISECELETTVIIFSEGQEYRKFIVKPFQTMSLKLPIFRGYNVKSISKYPKDKGNPNYMQDGVKFKDAPLGILIWSLGTPLNIHFLCPYNA